MLPNNPLITNPKLSFTQGMRANYKTHIKHYAVFNGLKESRREYWKFVLAAVVTTTVFTIVATLISMVIPGLAEYAMGYVFIYMLFLVLPLLAATARRIRDSGFSGRFVVLLIAAKILYLYQMFVAAHITVPASEQHTFYGFVLGAVLLIFAVLVPLIMVVVSLVILFLTIVPTNFRTKPPAHCIPIIATFSTHPPKACGTTYGTSETATDTHTTNSDNSVATADTTSSDTTNIDK